MYRWAERYSAQRQSQHEINVWILVVKNAADFDVTQKTFDPQAVVFQVKCLKAHAPGRF